MAKISNKQTQNTAGFDAEKKNNKWPSWINYLFLGIAVLLLFVAVFKNISYPLFWADESMTAMHGTRVLKYGYPKIHDGKNVVYDLRHDDKELGMNKEDDSFIAGTSWAHYYVAALPLKIAENFEDFYTKTRIVRGFFAFCGLLGLFFFIYTASLYIKDRNTLILFVILVLLTQLVSIPFLLHLRQVRYYPLILLSTGMITWLFCTYYHFKKIKYYLYLPVLCTLLIISFHVYFPLVVIISFFLMSILGINFLWSLSRSGFDKAIFLQLLLDYVPFILAALLLIPQFQYFEIFKITAALEKFNGYKINPQLYLNNLSQIFTYFWKYELLIPLVISTLLLIINFKKILKNDAIKQILTASFVLGWLVVVYMLMLSRVPNFQFIRYFINLQPLLSIILILNILAIGMLFSSSKKNQLVTTGILYFIILIFFVSRSSKMISGYITELKVPYKGPLDYAMDYIKKKYNNTDSLIIATNYEETSYMYYLQSKVIMGFIGNNLEEDCKLTPDIIIFRKMTPMPVDPTCFQGFLNQKTYTPVNLPVFDLPTNNNPEIQFPNKYLNHQYKTLFSDDQNTQLTIFELK